MLLLLSTLLLVVIAVFAASSMVVTWRQYGAAALALGDELRRTGELRSFTWTAQERTARRGPASVRHLPLKAPRVALRPALRAAA